MVLLELKPAYSVARPRGPISPHPCFTHITSCHIIFVALPHSMVCFSSLCFSSLSMSTYRCHVRACFPLFLFPLFLLVPVRSCFSPALLPPFRCLRQYTTSDCPFTQLFIPLTYVLTPFTGFYHDCVLRANPRRCAFVFPLYYLEGALGLTCRLTKVLYLPASSLGSPTCKP